MYRKKKRTLEKYRRAGAEMRLVKELVVKLCKDSWGVASAVDNEKLSRARDLIREVCSNIEDNMFQDFPELSDDYVNVFYGDLKRQPANQVDAEQMALAERIANFYFDETASVDKSVISDQNLKLHKKNSNCDR